MSNIPLDNDLDIFGAAIPGQSLTANPGQFPYEKPPLTSNPENALNSLVEHIQTPAAKKTIINLLEAGLTAETIASALVLGGVSEGLYDVNVAELIKAPLIMYLVEIGDDENIDMIGVLNTIPDEEGMSEEEGIQLMQQISPNDRFPKYSNKISEQLQNSQEILNMLAEENVEEDIGFAKRIGSKE
tara:strand:+ start:728 stop:1285 length:558 start_codon:yes stop_codon:yes gene_type:complete